MDWNDIFFFKSIKYNKITDWIFTGCLAALGFLTKYIFAYLLISLFFYLIFISSNKKGINFNFLYALLTFFLITAPHFQWLILVNTKNKLKYFKNF